MATRRLSREESRAQTRERLMDAARHVFARGGYGGASIDTIAAEAGYSKGAFYSNFESKEAIFLELLARHMAAEAQQLDQLVDVQQSPDAVLANLDLWLQHLNEDADWALLSMELQLHARRSPAFAEAYDALQARHRDRLAALVTRLFALSGRKLPAPAAQIAASMMALAHGLVLQRTSRNPSRDQAGALITLVLRSLMKAALPR